MRPQLWVVGGPNGAGKSTIVERFSDPRVTVVNPDIYALGLPAELDDTARILAAGRLAVRAREAMIAAGQTFLIETTLTGNSELAVMRAAAQRGFKVNLVYVGLRDILSSIGRVSNRVAAGGHDVPVTDLNRRFDRSFGNLPAAMALAERVILIDNSGRRRRFLYSAEAGRVKFAAADLPAWATAALA